MKKMNSKKGLFFTLISLVLVSIVTSIFIQSTAGLQKDEATSLRIQTLDSFISQMESSYLPIALQVAGFKGINETISWMNEEDEWLISPSRDLGSVLTNGTIGNEVIMTNNTLSNFSSSLQKISASSYGMTLMITIKETNITQIVPWQLEIKSNISIEARTDVANWSRQGIIISAVLPIEGLVDPLFITNTNGEYHKIIHRASIQPMQWNAQLLSEFIASENYTRFEGSSAPSYLERFRQIPGQSACCGIESTVNPLKGGDLLRSYADYQFFANNPTCDGNLGTPDDVYTFNAQLPANFKLDFDHSQKYDLTAQSLGNC